MNILADGAPSTSAFLILTRFNEIEGPLPLQDIANTVIVIGLIATTIITVVGGILVAAIRQWTKVQHELAKTRIEQLRVQVEATAAQKQATEAMPDQLGAKLQEYLSPMFRLYIDRSNEFTVQAAALRADLLTAQSELLLTKATLKSLQDQFEMARVKAETDIQARDRQIAALSRDLEQLKADRDSALVTANHTITDLQGQLAAARNELETTKGEMLKLQSRVEALEKQVSDMQTERDAIIAERDQAIRERDALRAERDKLAADLATLMARLTEQDKQIAALQNELMALKTAPVAGPLPESPAPEMKP